MHGQNVSIVVKIVIWRTWHLTVHGDTWLSVGVQKFEFVIFKACYSTTQYSKTGIAYALLSNIFLIGWQNVMVDMLER